MDKDIKNEEVDEEIVNPTAEDTENVAEEKAENKDEKVAEAPKELTPEEKIAELEKQIEELKNQQLYKVAEFDNFRKRVMQEKADLIKNGGSKVITTLLPIIDDLERAQQNMDKYEDVAAVKEGLNLIIDKFFKLLAQEGLKKMDVVGQPFDSDLHEAIAMVPGQPDKMKGKVMDCMTAGYTLNDKVIRYAKVAVAE
ncbi:MAG: nucleotide exchange factor GrpE [Bacteroidaceae bacterium]|jgi:molecular chaperone GrpE|nr:nucleotide exchange factor GrpE [Bacteroidaceae bacterium]